MILKLKKWGNFEKKSMKDTDFEVDNEVGLPEVEFNARFEHFWRLFVEKAERGMGIKKIDLLGPEVRRES